MSHISVYEGNSTEYRKGYDEAQKDTASAAVLMALIFFAFGLVGGAAMTGLLVAIF